MAQQESLSSAQRSLLSRATSATSEPTPGYVYKDITDMVMKDPAILPTVEDYLLHKLVRNEPYIKFKCLKLLKNLCVRLPHEFNRNKVCQNHAVMEARNYKAPHSEYNGDYLCHMVRNEVEDLLKAVYGQQGTAAAGAPPSVGGQNPMVGFGNMPAAQQSATNGFAKMGGATPSGYHGPSGVATGFGNTTVGSGGFGNTGFGSKPSSSGTGFGNTAFGNAVASGTKGYGSGGFGSTGFGNSPGSSSAGFGNSGYSSATGVGNMGGFGSGVPQTSSIKSSGSGAFKLITDVAKYLPNVVMDKIGRVGSAFSSTTPEQYAQRVAPMPGMHQTGVQSAYVGGFAADHQARGQQAFGQAVVPERTLLPTLIPDTTVQRSAADDISGEAEVKLVKDVLTFSGVKVTPSQQILDDFLARLKDLNVRYVVDELLRSVNNRANKWQLQLRILCVFEALLLRASMGQDVVSHLTAELEPILGKCREEGQLKNKAERLIQLLGNAESASAGVTKLISFGSSAHVTSQATSAGETAVPLDLFGGPAAKEEGGKAAEPLRSVPSDFTNAAFDIMDSFTPISSVRTPQAAQANKASQADAVDDLFNFDKLTVGPSKSRAASTEEDLFAALDSGAFQPQARGSTDLI
ncbi:uncharacterized protein BcabD6B2_29490 [Babesia caballi]|uniref:ENTH domain-containing protein n=1 Tax=Babesia caballi TaxID=5871 RepID=A0AAV4LUN3_BABCB|nr:hypothetical protein, conserved [Babesia caballi]